jgi:hypothetical protein
MGSPCNTFGNEPNGGTAGSSPTPTGTAQGTSPFPNCSRTPTFWGVLEGPETGKVQGDRYSTRNCESSGVDGCTGTVNDEYGPKLSATSSTAFGYTFVVKVQPAAVNTNINLQVYDPIMLNVGQSCELLPGASSFGSTGNANSWVTNADAKNRYSKDGSSTPTYCTGDSYAGNGSRANPPHAMTTSFVLRQQADSLDPTAAPVQNDTGGSPCIKQYGSYVNPSNTALSANVFKSTGGSTYNADVARMFHNWVSLCTFRPTRSGDYYLQVRTNVSLGGSGTGLERSGNMAAAALQGNTTTGEGSNAFSLRAVTQSGREKDVAVAGYEHMPIFINADTATANFNLIRVLPGAAGQSISFSYFDAGDAAGTGSVKVLPPTDATGSITSTPFPGNCKASGGSAGSGATLSNCSAPLTQSGGVSRNNGKTETIIIPIPSDYTCNVNSFGGCWYRVQVSFASGSVHDVTTWDATIIGDPVRLIK